MRQGHHPPRKVVRILGVDPGSIRFGWGIIEMQGNDVRYIASGVFRLPPRDALPNRLGQVLRSLEELLLNQQVHVVAVEQAFVYKNPRTALVIGQVRGLPIALAAARGLEVAEYQPSVIKRAVVGSGRASKEQVSAMVQFQLGLSAVPQEDEGDALAVALTHARDPTALVASVDVSAKRPSAANAYYASVMAAAKGRKRR